MYIVCVCVCVHLKFSCGMHSNSVYRKYIHIHILFVYRYFSGEILAIPYIFYVSACMYLSYLSYIHTFLVKFSLGFFSFSYFQKCSKDWLITFQKLDAGDFEGETSFFFMVFCEIKLLKTFVNNPKNWQTKNATKWQRTLFWLVCCYCCSIFLYFYFHFMSYKNISNVR